MPVTLSTWLGLRPEARSVVLDQLLEGLPVGYVHAADVGHAPAVVPQFLHPATGVLFHAVFGDEVLVGMSEARFARVAQVQRARLRPGEEADEEDLPDLVPAWEEVRAFQPPRRIEVPALLVGEVLSAHQLHNLGVPEDLLLSWGVRPAGLGAALKGLARVGWRAPSEVEWEFALRAGMDSLDDAAPPLSPAMRFLSDMGARLELCRDTWHPDWVGAPLAPQGWGEGHQVLRGAGAGVRFAWSAPPGWAECLWPSRRVVSTGTLPIAVRPVLSL